MLGEEVEQKHGTIVTPRLQPKRIQDAALAQTKVRAGSKQDQTPF